MASSDIVSSIKHRRCFTLECCLICISQSFILSFLVHFFFNLEANGIDFALSSPKWILTLLSAIQSHVLEEPKFNCFSV